MNEIKNPKKERKTIFIVEDEPDILQLISINLEKAGFDVRKFLEAGQMVTQLSRQIPDLLILDLMLPDYDGLDICKTLRNDTRYAEIPIIMVTAKTEELDIVLGLELGADDYITKPFSPRELTARVKAILRRGKPQSENSREAIVISDILVIDPVKYEVRVRDEIIALTSTEFLILKLLAEKPGWVFSREKILNIVWRDEKDVFDRTVDVHMKNLRDKLGEAGKLIKSIRGVGYKLEL
jgi:two-component system phosphate regulon response regulator PhoB/two-component system alkaline phosphatase synthesis response regulator PhoP